MEILKQIARLFGRRNPQFESLTEFVAYDDPVSMADTERRIKLRVRIWRTETNICEAAVPDRRDLNDMWRACAARPVVVIANEFGSMDRVACVAIVDAQGNGLSYYPDWH